VMGCECASNIRISLGLAGEMSNVEFQKCAYCREREEAAVHLSEAVLSLGPDETPSLALILNWQHLARVFQKKAGIE